MILFMLKMFHAFICSSCIYCQKLNSIYNPKNCDYIIFYILLKTKLLHKTLKGIDYIVAWLLGLKFSMYSGHLNSTNLQCPSVKSKLFQSVIVKVTNIRNETSDTLNLAYWTWPGIINSSIYIYIYISHPLPCSLFNRFLCYWVIYFSKGVRCLIIL